MVVVLFKNTDQQKNATYIIFKVVSKQQALRPINSQSNIFKHSQVGFLTQPS